jgi:hypothetical protein
MANLPTFQISEIATDHCLGRLDPYSLLNEKWAFCLLVRNQVIWGRFLNIDENQTSAEFWPENPALLRELTAGVAVTFLDDYLGQRAEAVLDVGRTWDRALFEARDAVQYSTGLMTIAGPDAPAGGVIVPGGWNHTHCFVCHATISEVHPVFYQSSEGERVCEACHTNYIVPRSLAFLRTFLGG